jgi:hypothetical protein
MACAGDVDRSDFIPPQHMTACEETYRGKIQKSPKERGSRR